jgi:FolB domain-containing protein
MSTSAAEGLFAEDLFVGVRPMAEDRIEIRDLLLRGIIGVNDWERREKQDILVNITLFADLRAAGAGDDLTRSVNYRAVAKQVIEHVEVAQRFTVEALATDIARICLALEGVSRVRVRVEKPGAVRFARSVGVEIERQAGDFG